MWKANQFEEVLKGPPEVGIRWSPDGVCSQHLFLSSLFSFFCLQECAPKAWKEKVNSVTRELFVRWRPPNFQLLQFWEVGGGYSGGL